MSNKVEATYHGGPFPGKPHTAPATEPLRTFEVHNSDAESIATIKATYVSFQAAHVAFWIERGDEADELVWAVANTEAHYVAEAK